MNLLCESFHLSGGHLNEAPTEANPSQDIVHATHFVKSYLLCQNSPKHMHPISLATRNLATMHFR